MEWSYGEIRRAGCRQRLNPSLLQTKGEIEGSCKWFGLGLACDVFCFVSVISLYVNLNFVVFTTVNTFTTVNVFTAANSVCGPDGYT